jgi:glycosyltransferase involved in cell wall biosynthesis
LELVISITNADFIMIGGPGNDLEFYNKIENKAKQIPNLRFLGFIPFGEIDVYFNKASVLVNTSMFEGFSNTFIQAWMNCVPVITLNSDPDEVVCKYKLGFHSRTFEQLVQDATEIISNKKLRNQMGINGRRYVEKEHNIKLVLENYVQLIYNLAI